MKAIAMFNNKGGVGKTTVLSNLASWLSLNEHKKRAESTGNMYRSQA